jgi:hypothetical protein
MRQDGRKFGVIAEQVEKVSPDLVVRDEDGRVNAVRYEAVNAMLLNEFLKKHGKVEEQDRKMQEQEATMMQQWRDFQASITNLEATIAKQQKQIEALTTGLHKVSAELELSGKPAPQTIANSR